MREGKPRGRRRLAVTGATAVAIAAGPVASAAGDESSSIVMDDFESGRLTGWQAATINGGWVVYSDAQPAQPGSDFPPDPPQGEFAAVTEPTGPGTRILYRDVTLDGEMTLHLTVFYETLEPLNAPETLGSDAPEPNQQFRVDLVDPEAPFDSMADGDVLAGVFSTEPSDPMTLEPTEVSVDVSELAGRTVRLRIAQVDNQGPMSAGVDDIRFEAMDAGAAIELPVTPAAHRLTEAEALQAVAERAGELTEADEFSGAMLIAGDGEVLLEEAWGEADREAGTPNTIDTRFRIGSMNKMFTAVATLQLIEAGELALDEPIATYLPDYPNADLASKVTVRHLLTHTGGTGDFFGPEYDEHRLELREHSDYVDLFGERGVLFEPGSRWEYSNYGFILLGAVIESVTGESYYDYVREHVYQPAGMTSTDSLPEDENVPDRAVAYGRPMGPEGDWESVADTLPYRGTAAGGGYSTVGDLSRFAEALQAGTLVSTEMLAEATSPQGEEFYGFGFDVGTDPSTRWGHGGGAPGMNGDLRVYPDVGYVVVVLANLDPPAAHVLADYFTLRMPVEAATEQPSATTEPATSPTAAGDEQSSPGTTTASLARFTP
jgi:CubicO group peptidase (beta-lactamase class C family)